MRNNGCLLVPKSLTPSMHWLTCDEGEDKKHTESTKLMDWLGSVWDLSTENKPSDKGDSEHSQSSYCLSMRPYRNHSQNTEFDLEDHYTMGTLLGAPSRETIYVSEEVREYFWKNGMTLLRTGNKRILTESAIPQLQNNRRMIVRKANVNKTDSIFKGIDAVFGVLVDDE